MIIRLPNDADYCLDNHQNTVNFSKKENRNWVVKEHYATCEYYRSDNCNRMEFLKELDHNYDDMYQGE